MYLQPSSDLGFLPALTSAVSIAQQVLPFFKSKKAAQARRDIEYQNALAQQAAEQQAAQQAAADAAAQAERAERRRQRQQQQDDFTKRQNELQLQAMQVQIDQYKKYYAQPPKADFAPIAGLGYLLPRYYAPGTRVTNLLPFGYSSSDAYKDAMKKKPPPISPTTDMRAMFARPSPAMYFNRVISVR